MYNESSIIESTVETLTGYMDDHFSSYELLFVDDGSTDNSAELVERMHKENVRVIAYQPNRGKGCAVRTGMVETKGDIALFLDADLAYGTDVVSQAVKIMEDDPHCDIVIGSRAIHPEGYEGYTPIRKLASKVYIKVLNIIGGFKLSDSQCGFKVFRNKAAHDIFKRMKTDNFAFDLEALLWAQKLKYSITEMPVKIVNHRESKVHVFSDTFKMLNQIRAIKKYVNK